MPIKNGLFRLRCVVDILGGVLSKEVHAEGKAIIGYHRQGFGGVFRSSPARQLIGWRLGGFSWLNSTSHIVRSTRTMV